MLPLLQTLSYLLPVMTLALQRAEEQYKLGVEVGVQVGVYCTVLQPYGLH